MKCVHMTGMDSIQEISVDSAKALLHPVVNPEASPAGTTKTISLAAPSSPCPLLKAFNVNRQALTAMNTLAGNAS